MGVVYKALDTKLDREVALKFLPNHLLGDEEVRKRFEREAKAAAALDHSNVCTVYEIDEADGKTFIAMALIEGESLDKKIENGPLKLDDALDIAQQAAKGLEAAHEKGVVLPRGVVLPFFGPDVERGKSAEVRTLPSESSTFQASQSFVVDPRPLAR